MVRPIDELEMTCKEVFDENTYYFLKYLDINGLFLA
jgi:hypothetical protein